MMQQSIPHTFAADHSTSRAALVRQGLDSNLTFTRLSNGCNCPVLSCTHMKMLSYAAANQQSKWPALCTVCVTYHAATALLISKVRLRLSVTLLDRRRRCMLRAWSSHAHDAGATCNLLQQLHVKSPEAVAVLRYF